MAECVVFACGHCCPIPEGQPGVCKVRYNRGGTVYVPWGYAGVVQCVPWHATAFHKDYKMTDPDNTSAQSLMRAAEIGKRAGLRNVYAGNLPGEVGDFENTRCHNCQQLLVERYGYLIMGYHLTSNGCCPSCGTRIPGRWTREFQKQITAHPFLPRARSSPFSMLRPSASM